MVAISASARMTGYTCRLQAFLNEGIAPIGKELVQQGTGAGNQPLFDERQAR